MVAYATFVDCWFSEGTLDFYKCERAKFDECNFQLVSIMDSKITNVVLNQCTFRGVSLIDCDFSGSMFSQVRFLKSHRESRGSPGRTCTFRHIDFSGTTWNAVDFADSRLRSVSFNKAILNDVRMAEANISSTSFDGVTTKKFEINKKLAVAFKSQELDVSLDVLDVAEDNG